MQKLVFPMLKFFFSVENLNVMIEISEIRNTPHRKCVLYNVY